MDPVSLLVGAVWLYCMYRAARAGGRVVRDDYRASRDSRQEDLVERLGMPAHTARRVAGIAGLGGLAAHYRSLPRAVGQAARRGWGDARDEWGASAEEHRRWVEERRHRPARAHGRPRLRSEISHDGRLPADTPEPVPPGPPAPPPRVPWIFEMRSRSGRKLNPVTGAPVATGMAWSDREMARRLQDASLDPDLEATVWRGDDPERTPVDTARFRRPASATPSAAPAPAAAADSPARPDPRPGGGPDHPDPGATTGPDPGEHPELDWATLTPPTPGGTAGRTPTPTHGGTTMTVTGEAGSYEATLNVLQQFEGEAAALTAAGDQMSASVQNGGLRDAETIGDIAGITEACEMVRQRVAAAHANVIRRHGNTASAIASSTVQAAETDFYAPH